MGTEEASSSKAGVSKRVLQRALGVWALRSLHLSTPATTGLRQPEVNERVCVLTEQLHSQALTGPFQVLFMRCSFSSCPFPLPFTREKLSLVCRLFKNRCWVDLTCKPLFTVASGPKADKGSRTASQGK